MHKVNVFAMLVLCELVCSRQHMPDCATLQDHHMRQIHEMQQAPPQQQMNDEPIVGGPIGLDLGLLGLQTKMGMAKMFGIPGFRFGNINAGHIGPMKYANSLLGAENPMAEQQVGTHHHYHFDDANLGPSHQFDPLYYQAEQQVGAPQHYQAEPQLGALQHMEYQYNYNIQPQQYKAEPSLATTPTGYQYNYNLQPENEYQFQQFAGEPQQYQVAAAPEPVHFDMNAQRLPKGPHIITPGQFKMDPNQFTIQPPHEARHWDLFPKHDNYGYGHDYGYGDDKDYSKGYDKGYKDKGHHKGHPKGHAHKGYDESYNNGYNKGYGENKYEKGYGQNKYEKGYGDKGYSKGYENSGYEKGYDKGYQKGGYEKGYQKGGYEKGYGGDDYGKGYNSYGSYSSYGGGSYGGYKSAADQQLAIDQASTAADSKAQGPPAQRN